MPRKGTSGQQKAASLTKGTINNLVVFIRFKGESEFTTAPGFVEAVDNTYHSSRTSVQSYFDELSLGQLSIETHMLPQGNTSESLASIQTSHTRDYYQPKSKSNPEGYIPYADEDGCNVIACSASDRSSHDADPSDGTVCACYAHGELTEHVDGFYRRLALFKECLRQIVNQIPATLDVDNNGDGYVDALTFWVKGSAGSWNDLLWPHQWSLLNATELTLLAQEGYCYLPPGFLDAQKRADLQDIYFGGKIAFADYNMVTGDTIYAQNGYQQHDVDGNMIGNVGILAHEMSHVLGFPDLYHYDDTDAPDPIGQWDLMSANGTIPQYYNTYSRARYGGWLGTDAIRSITTDGEYALSPTSTLHDKNDTYAYRIQMPGFDGEEIYLEYRKQNGLFENRSNIPGSGLLIYRVDTQVEPDAGNMYGPPDEVFVYRPNRANSVTMAALDGVQRTSFGTVEEDAGLANSIWSYRQDEKNMGVVIYDVHLDEETGQMHFRVEMGPPTVQKTIPALTATGVDVTQPLTVQFSETVQAGTAFSGIELTKDGRVVSAEMTLAGDTLQIIPSAPLDIDSDYILTIPWNAVVDRYGKEMENAFIMDFSTRVVKAESIQLYPSALTMNQGDTKQLSVVFSPENVTNQTVRWQSSDDAVLTVDENGKITALQTGDAMVTATTADGLTAQSRVSVQLRNGWFEENGRHYYYRDDVKQTGWLVIDHTRYYLDPKTGVRRGGWLFIDSNWYYADPDTGQIRTGWWRLRGGMYYFQSDGRMTVGEVRIDGTRHIFDEEGHPRTGWIKLDGKLHYFSGERGAELTGLANIENKRYIFDANGVLKTGWISYKGGWYWANASGVLAEGWVKTGGKWYLLSGSGAMQTGWVKMGGKWYYFAADGKMVASASRRIGKKTYRFAASGICLNP